MCIRRLVAAFILIAAFFTTLRQNCEPVTDLDRWYRILSYASSSTSKPPAYPPRASTRLRRAEVEQHP